MTKNETKIVKNIITGLLFVMAFLFAISISGNGTDLISFWKGLGAQILFLMISFLIYNSSQYQSVLIGIDTKHLGRGLMFGVIGGIVYTVLTSLVPGLSIAVPLVPNAISSNLRFFIVVIVAPIVETVFFLGALLAYIRNFEPKKNKIFIAILIQAVIFALFHLGAYIIGLYDLPGFTAGFGAFTANISVFLSATIFGTISGLLVAQKRLGGLIVAIAMHLVINFVIYGKYAISFA